MIDENKDWVTKPILITTVKTLSEYNDRNRVAAEQKNEKTDSKIEKLANIQAQIDAQADLLWAHAHRELNKKCKIGPYVLFLLKQINK